MKKMQRLSFNAMQKNAGLYVFLAMVVTKDKITAAVSVPNEVINKICAVFRLLMS